MTRGEKALWLLAQFRAVDRKEKTPRQAALETLARITTWEIEVIDEWEEPVRPKGN